MADRLEPRRYEALDCLQGPHREPGEQPEPEPEWNRDQPDGRDEHRHVVADEKTLGELLDGEHSQDRGPVGDRAGHR